MANEPSAQPGEPKTPQGDPKQSGEPVKPTEKDPPPQYVTPDILTGVLARQLKTYEEKLGKTVGSYEEGLKQLREDLAALKEAKEPVPAGKTPSTTEPPELVELRKRVKELEDAKAKAILAAEASDKKEKDYRFQTTVKDALVRHDCSLPDVVYPAIAPKLKVDPETGEITGTEKTEFGVRDLTLDEYIKTVVAKATVPQLFKGTMRPGSAAGGDEGLGEGGHKFTIEQLRDPAFYEKNLEAVRAAVEQKQVKLDHTKT